ncbi:DEAD/DEAH box helicase [Candidatus Dependentiae bacterium]|nr:DEAD/DEAH box helicase [Candidatus Dependentiae bacterium]
MNTFKELNLAPALEKILDELGFIEPTEIQQKAIPLLLTHKKVDFHGQAQTGTGKTLAFGIPLLHKIDSSAKVPQALIVAPTRELAVQIKDSIGALARVMNIRIEAIYGGVSMDEQVSALRRGCHIVVGTPGRLNDHLRRKTLSVADVKTLVLDEADIMLDMGFKEEVDEILHYVAKNREIWLFSATTKSGIADIMKSHMHDTISVRVSRKQVATEGTKQYYCIVPYRSKMQALHRFIESAPDFYGFIFCQTKILTSDVAEQLIKRGYNVGALHGDMSQAQRNIVIKKFKNCELSIVVATDVAARGIDVANLTHVVNYSVPEDHESYIHRIGRTGRAGKEGIAITLINKQEIRLMQYIQRKFTVVINPIDVPSRETILTARIEEARRYMDHLASLSHTTDASLEAMVDNLSPEKMRLTLAHILHDKFLSTLEHDDISFTPSQRAYLPEEAQEIYINVGSDDGVTRDDVVDYLTKTGCVKDEQIQKVRVIKRRSFIQIPAECAGPIIQALRGTSLGGRRTRVSLIEENQNQNQTQRGQQRPRLG